MGSVCRESVLSIGLGDAENQIEPRALAQLGGLEVERAMLNFVESGSGMALFRFRTDATLAGVYI